MNDDEFSTNYALVACCNIVFEAVKELDLHIEELSLPNDELVDVRDDLLAVCERIRKLQTL